MKISIENIAHHLQDKDRSFRGVMQRMSHQNSLKQVFTLRTLFDRHRNPMAGRTSISYLNNALKNNIYYMKSFYTEQHFLKLFSLWNSARQKYFYENFSQTK